MEKLTTKEIKQIYIEELDFLDSLCRNNGLEYYIMFGTLMGAIRDKGFIPWDIDIDVFVPRSSAEKLKELIPEGSKYRITYKYLYEGSEYPVRLYIEDTTTLVPSTGQGVFLDGAIFDYVASDKKSIVDHLDDMLTIKYDVIYRKGRSIFKQLLVYVAKAFFGLIPNKYIEKKIKKFNTSKSEGTYIHKCRTSKKNYAWFNSEWFENVVEVDFEGKKYLAPSCYDEILTQVYGDYMVPCPEWRRKRKMEKMIVAYRK